MIPDDPSQIIELIIVCLYLTCVHEDMRVPGYAPSMQACFVYLLAVMLDEFLSPRPDGVLANSLCGVKHSLFLSLSPCLRLSHKH